MLHWSALEDQRQTSGRQAPLQVAVNKHGSTTTREIAAIARISSAGNETTTQQLVGRRALVPVRCRVPPRARASGRRKPGPHISGSAEHASEGLTRELRCHAHRATPDTCEARPTARRVGIQRAGMRVHAYAKWSSQRGRSSGKSWTRDGLGVDRLPQRSAREQRQPDTQFRNRVQPAH